MMARSVLVGLLAAWAPLAAGQVVYADLARDFVPGINPGDTMLATTARGTWRLYSTTSTAPIPDSADELAWDTAGNWYEPIGNSHTDGFNSAVIIGPGAATPDELQFHPGPDTLGILAEWTALTDISALTLEATARKFDLSGGDGVEVSLIVNSVLVDQVTLSFDQATPVSFGADVGPITAGSTVSLLVRNNGTFISDNTAVSLRLVPAPASSVALAAPAIVLVASRFRRRS